MKRVYDALLKVIDYSGTIKCFVGVAGLVLLFLELMQAAALAGVIFMTLELLTRVRYKVEARSKDDVHAEIMAEQEVLFEQLAYDIEESKIKVPELSF